jgi:hypothetical protein
MLFHEWLRERKFYHPEEMEGSIAEDTFDPAFDLGVYEYPCGFITEMKELHKGKRYHVLVCNEDEIFEHLHDAEVWLWEKWSRDELAQDADTSHLDGQCG